MVLRTTTACVVVLGAIGLLAGCSDINHDPVIAGITASPSGEVRPETEVKLRVQATDRDGDALSYAWEVTVGRLSAAGGDSAIWTAPENASTAVVTVVCEDGRGGSASAAHSVAVRAWLRDDASAMLDDIVEVPNPGTVTFELEWDHDIPAGALVDSVVVYELAMDPDSLEGEDFLIWIIAPSGTEILVWDRFPGQPTLDETRVQGIAGEQANGIWRFRVEQLSKGVDAVVEDAEIEVYYRY